ncbi:MAG: alpha-D-ribose 1-methylphosphonate 5-triphosphate diphosphatase [Cytophagales bacterium]|nr:alpha-D-ribose 1-methylphosphonate 5-triphosphate diphosphatase [Cytophagales bacterium]
MNNHILSNAHVITPIEDFEGSVVIENGIITAIKKGVNYREGINLNKRWLIPGCIDIHSDYLEKELHPRPSASFSMPFAFHFMDQRAIACGITTLFNAISFSENSQLNRSFESAIEKAKDLDKYCHSGMIRHFIHSRLDPNSTRVVEYLDEMKNISSLKLVVINDSIPGQRQFNLEDLIEKRARLLQISFEESEKLLKAQIEDKSQVDMRPEIQSAFLGSVPLGSHDDTTIEHVMEARQHGATLSEMPTTIEAARKAKALGMWVCMGAPNYVRGGSHCGNLACQDALQENLVDMLCSDYHFPTVLGAMIKMVRNGIKPSIAVNFISLNPAKFLGIHEEMGSIEVGKKADLVAFEDEADFAKVSHVWVNGKLKFMAENEGINAINWHKWQDHLFS